jgi:hypothetical protein
VITRRDALCLAVAGGLSLQIPATRGFAATGSESRVVDKPEELLTAFMRLSGSLDDRLIIWWMDGLRYGVVDARAKLLFGMQVGMFHRFFRQPDGSYKVAMFELTYYTDLATGNLLDRFENPYTGESNRVSHVRLGPEVRHQTVDGIARPDNPMVHDYNSELGPALIRGDDIWIPTDVEARIKFPKPTAPEIILNHYTTVHGRLSDALNPDVVSAPATLAFQNILKWEPFMKMGDHPGHLMSRTAGRKLESVDDLPDSYLAMAQQKHAKFIADPIATLEPLTRDL